MAIVNAGPFYKEYPGVGERTRWQGAVKRNYMYEKVLDF
jgi:hypothetical protein